MIKFFLILKKIKLRDFVYNNVLQIIIFKKILANVINVIKYVVIVR